MRCKAQARSGVKRTKKYEGRASELVTQQSAKSSSRVASSASEQADAVGGSRRVLMCRPDYFDIEYEINAWMDINNQVDTARAQAQWETLRAHYDQLGIEIELIEPVKGQPDMVFTANGALVIDGKVALPHFRYPERRPETEYFKKWFDTNGFNELILSKHYFEGEGDALVLNGKILAGWGFRSAREAHAELADFFGRQVISLRLVNERFYHIDTCLSILSEDAIAFYPGAFDEASRQTLRGLVKTVIEAEEPDAAAFGLNAVSFDGKVICSDRATGFHRQLQRAGFEPVLVDISEFQKSGGGVKCLTLSLRN